MDENEITEYTADELRDMALDMFGDREWSPEEMQKGLGLPPEDNRELVARWLGAGVITTVPGTWLPKYQFTAHQKTPRQRMPALPSRPLLEWQEKTPQLSAHTPPWWQMFVTGRAVITASLLLILGLGAWVYFTSPVPEDHRTSMHVPMVEATRAVASPTPTVWGTPIIGGTHGFYGVGGESAVILPAGTQVRIIGHTGDSAWLHIQTSDGDQYWVSMFDFYKIPVETLHNHATPTVIPTPIVQVQTLYLDREVPVYHEVPVYIQLPTPPPEVIERIVEVQAVAPPPTPIPLHLQPIPNDTPENYRRWQDQRDGNIASTP